MNDRPYVGPGAVGSLALAHETNNPANAWLASHRAARRAAIQRLEARGWALQYVRGGLGPSDPRERDKAIQALLRVPDSLNRVDLALAYLQGWVEHHAPIQENRP